VQDLRDLDSVNVSFGKVGFQDPAFTNRKDVGPHDFSVVGKTINKFPPNSGERQVCASNREAKNLAEVKGRTTTGPAGAIERAKLELKGKIIEFGWWLKKQGRAKGTIKLYMEMLKLLVKHGADVYDPESVKETLARLDGKSEYWKISSVAAYSSFLKMQGGTWQPPDYHVEAKLPFIPLETELDTLIAGCGKKTGIFLQLLKETGMRAGEALRLRWTDMDLERKLVILNDPEKRGTPRVFNVTSRLLGMLNALPKKGKTIFNCSYSSIRWCFSQSRRRLARKMNNPRLLQIHFHTFRHWKATMLYHETKDPLHVKETLGHKKMDTTLLYIQLDKALFTQESDGFTVKVAKNPDEIQGLLEVGFEWVGTKDGLVYLRKRK